MRGYNTIREVLNSHLKRLLAVDQPDFADAMVMTSPKKREQFKTRRVPPYNVILENDDHHSLEFVVGVLRKALGYSEQRASLLTQQAHLTGRSIVWTGPKEVAELKIEQMRSFHEIREVDNRKLGPVSCLIEPAPSG
jgi:ATP-dependent Clp protease adaptor protein ClpS